jgi:hypothetical protein
MIAIAASHRAHARNPCALGTLMQTGIDVADMIDKPIQQVTLDDDG